MKKIKFLPLSIFATLPTIMTVACRNEKVQEETNLVNIRSNLKSDQIYNLSNFGYEENNQRADIISFIKNYFAKNEHNELLKFKNPEASNETITYKKFVQNDFAVKYFNFDETGFKNLLQTKLGLNSKYLENFATEIQYFNIHRDLNNYLDVIIPVKVKILADKKVYKIGNLYQEFVLNFKIKNMKMEKSDANKYENLKTKFLEFQELVTNNNLNKNNFQLHFNNEIATKLNTNSIKNLTKSDLNKLVSLNLNENITNFITENQAKVVTNAETNAKSVQGYIFKVFVENIDFDNVNDFNQINLKVRFALAQPNKYSENGDTVVFDENNLLNLGFSQNYQINLDQNSFTNPDEYGKYLEAIENIIISENLHIELKNNNIYNFDFRWLKDPKFLKNNLVFLNTFNQNYKINWNINDFIESNLKGAKLKFNLEFNNKQYLITKEIGNYNFAYVFDPDFEDANPNVLDFNVNRLDQSNLTKVNENIFNLFGTNLFAGGYDTNRSFYGPNNNVPIFIHLGEDYIAPQKTAVVAPFDGEVIALYHIPSKEVGAGIGTTLVMRTEVENLKTVLSPREYEDILKRKWDQNSETKDYVYIGFIHLDRENTLNNQAKNWIAQEVQVGNRQMHIVTSISPNNPSKVNKNEVIGYLGTSDENGGWMTHAHIAIISNYKVWTNANDFGTLNKSPYEKRLTNYTNADGTIKNPSAARVPGVAGASKDPVNYEVSPITGEFILDEAGQKIKLAEIPVFYNNPMQNREITDSVIDPNYIYKLRGDSTLTFDITELFKIDN
ncbi:MSC_0775 family lipoprotein [Mycoplasmopsis gallinarum]|uniref:MSC_0775 family lipoprotein n=1 Tax=Mycoplasmopsis gallinarum TaxID=29557 RepID=UPI0004884F45|nr:hypothetical protein [Mycoplasmopsis gallinarum]